MLVGVDGCRFVGFHVAMQSSLPCHLHLRLRRHSPKNTNPCKCPSPSQLLAFSPVLKVSPHPTLTHILPPSLCMHALDRGLVGGVRRGVGRTLDPGAENAAHRREVHRGVGGQTLGQHFGLIVRPSLH